MQTHISLLFVAISTVVLQFNYGESKESLQIVHRTENNYRIAAKDIPNRLKNVYYWPNGMIGNQTYKQLVGNGFDFIVYDCESPRVDVSNLPPESFKFRKQYEYLMATVKSNYKCDKIDKSWRRPEDNAYVTFNIKTNKFQMFIETGTFKELAKRSHCFIYLAYLRHDCIHKLSKFACPIECELI